MIALQAADDGVIVPVRVRAAARRNGVAGEHDGALRIEVTAAPERGKANRAVGEILADLLGVGKSAVQLIAGATSPDKRFLAVGVDRTEARRRIETALAGG